MNLISLDMITVVDIHFKTDN